MRCYNCNANSNSNLCPDCRRLENHRNQKDKSARELFEKRLVEEDRLTRQRDRERDRAAREQAYESARQEAEFQQQLRQDSYQQEMLLLNNQHQLELRRIFRDIAMECIDHPVKGREKFIMFMGTTDFISNINLFWNDIQSSPLLLNIYFSQYLQVLNASDEQAMVDFVAKTDETTRSFILEWLCNGEINSFYKENALINFNNCIQSIKISEAKIIEEQNITAEKRRIENERINAEHEVQLNNIRKKIPQHALKSFFIRILITLFLGIAIYYLFHEWSAFRLAIVMGFTSFLFIVLLDNTLHSSNWSDIFKSFYSYEDPIVKKGSIVNLDSLFECSGVIVIVLLPVIFWITGMILAICEITNFSAFVLFPSEPKDFVQVLLLYPLAVGYSYFNYLIINYFITATIRYNNEFSIHGIFGCPRLNKSFLVIFSILAVSINLVVLHNKTYEEKYQKLAIKRRPKTVVDVSAGSSLTADNQNEPKIDANKENFKVGNINNKGQAQPNPQIGKNLSRNDDNNNKNALNVKEQSKKSERDLIKIKIVELKSELTKVEDEIESERKRWHDALAVINKHTNFKKTPVTQGSWQFYECSAASNVIKQVENGAPKLKAEKARIENAVKLLEK